MPNAIIPKLDSWVKMVPTLLKEQLLNPGASIIGEVTDGVIKLQSFKDKIIRRVLTHELVEIIYNNGMSSK